MSVKITELPVRALAANDVLVAVSDPAGPGQVTAQMTRQVAMEFYAQNISLDAARITSGTLADARIPGLDASKTTSGTFAVARIPDIPFSKITGTVTASASNVSILDTQGLIPPGTTNVEGAIAYLAAELDTLRGSGGGGDAWGDPVNANILPDADGTRDLGSSSVAFANLYVGGLTLDGTALAAGTNLSTGITQDVHDLGTVSSGTVTLDFADSNVQKLLNNGAFTLAPPSSGEGIITLQITNAASAGAITTSGWNYVRGDAFTTTNAHRFLCTCARIGTNTWLTVVAGQ